MDIKRKTAELARIVGNYVEEYEHAPDGPTEMTVDEFLFDLKLWIENQ